jgi:hypothetical protein
MCGGDQWRGKFQNCQTPQYALENYAQNGTDTQEPHPAPPVHFPGPDRRDNRQQTHQLSNHPVSMLELHAANHLVHWQPPEAFTGGPIRDSQAGVVTGDQATRNEQQKSKNGDDYGEAMMGGIVAGRGQNSSLKLIILPSCRDVRARGRADSRQEKKLAIE